MNIYSIYKATNVINNKVYIGFDSNWPKRYTDHKRVYKSETSKTKKFYNALKKYGWDSFFWEIIYQAKEQVSARKSHTLNVMEPYFIKEYNTYHCGYNSTSGGDRGPTLIGSQNGMFGKTHSDAVKTKLGHDARTRFKGKSYEEIYGKDKANELKHKRSLSAKGKNNSANYNPRFDDTEYTFLNSKTGEILHCTRWILIHHYGINKSQVSGMINHGKSTKYWHVLFV